MVIVAQQPDIATMLLRGLVAAFVMIGATGIINFFRRPL